MLPEKLALIANTDASLRRIEPLAIFSMQSEPSYDSYHPAPAQQADYGRNLGVVVENAQVREDSVEIVLNKFRVAGGDQGQNLRSRVGHVGCGVEPVLEKKEKAENETSGLPLVKEIHCQKKWHQPLQQRASPQTESGARTIQKDCGRLRGPPNSRRR